MKRLLILILALIVAALACGTQTPSAPAAPFPTLTSSVFELKSHGLWIFSNAAGSFD